MASMNYPPAASMHSRGNLQNMGGTPPGGSMQSVPQTMMGGMPKSMPPMPMGTNASIPGTMGPSFGAGHPGGMPMSMPQTGMHGEPSMGGYNSMPAGGMPPMASMQHPSMMHGSMPHPSMGGMPPTSMPPQHMQSMGGGGPPLAMAGQYMPGVSRPQMTSVANPPVVADNIQYGPSYKMQYQKRSAADKTAVKYTGFLPLEGVYEEDTCRIG